MLAQELPTASLGPNPLECWDDESPASALRALAVRLHSTGFSLRETATALEQFGVIRSHRSVWQWIHRTFIPAVDITEGDVLTTGFTSLGSVTIYGGEA